MKYRITHPDIYNWCIEEWQEGGGTIERGRYKGQVQQARWKAAENFYPTLDEAAKGLLRRAAGDAILTQEANSILEAIKIAEGRVIETLESLPQEVRGLQQKP